MQTETIKKFNWFWAWQDEKEEAWLAEMAGQGLHLESVSPFGIYHFRKGQPRKDAYRLDFQTLMSKDRESYLQLFEDAGWEHIGDMGGWVYFRHSINGSEIPEIYSDLESKQGKYQRVMMYLVILSPIMIFVLPNIGGRDAFGPILTAILEGFGAILILLFSYAMIRLFLRINQLKNRERTR